MMINATRIEILMAEQGLNQRELGERCGLSRQNVGSILSRGSAQPKTVGKLAAGLGVSVKELITRAGPETRDSA